MIFLKGKHKLEYVNDKIEEPEEDGPHVNSGSLGIDLYGGSH